MKHRESSFGILFRHWLKAHPQYTCAIEAKQTETDSIPFSCVTQEQIDYGKAIKSSEGVLIRTTGATGLPDYIYLRNEPSYVVIKYPKFFCLIDIDIFARESLASKRRSLTSERAMKIAFYTVDLP